MINYIAIGDIHGMDGLLDSMITALPAEGTLVFLGDYIDRGPGSRNVIVRLLQLAEERPCIFLSGNHEAMALAAAAGDTRMERFWLANGGLATLESYGGRLPDEHLAFFRQLRPYHMTDEYYFVHAGVVPGKRLEEMRHEDMLWIRDPFLASQEDWGRLIIHGHTPTSTRLPDVRSNRINLDSGAVYGGALSALLLPQKEFIILAADENPGRQRAGALI